MNDDKQYLITELKNKIKTIIDLYENQKNLNKELEKRNGELQEELNLLKNKMSEVEERYENLRLAKALVSSDNETAHEARIKVNRIVREIDKCIALLNR